MELIFDPKKGVYGEGEALDKLRNDYFGDVKDGKIFLMPVEALYLMNFRGFSVIDKKGKVMSFNEIASFFMKNEKRLLIRYNAYRDWRDRGLIIRRFNPAAKGKHKKKNLKKYPSGKIKKMKINTSALWYRSSSFSIIEKGGKELFEKYWFGQYGIYKQNRGSMLKLNFLETIFLSKHFSMNVINAETKKQIKWENILKSMIKKREYAKQLYEIYEDWRLRGYIVKTGFKFGSHFRIYFPNASPMKKGGWVHSKHVLHVFPKDRKMLISEWSRAVRVAHGVKKTFILGIPELKKNDYVDYPADFLSYKRKKEKNSWVRETPKDKPRYLLVSVSEDEHIGGIELASLLKKSNEMGLNLLLSITDRETAITYYVLKKIILPDSKYEYYEIEWEKP